MGFFSGMFSGKKQMRENIALISEFLDKDDVDYVKELIKSHKARFSYSDYSTSEGFLNDSRYLSLSCNVIDEKVKVEVAALNDKIAAHTKKKLFEEFCHDAKEKIFSLMMPEDAAFNPVKYAALAQLFSRKNIHVLLMADPAIDKKMFLKSISGLSHNSVFTNGLGSKEAGLTALFKEGAIVKGSLPRVDKGMVFINDLNLLQTIDRAGFIDAMNKGVIEYRKKGGSSVMIPSHVRILACASPEEESFVGNIISVLKKQIPLDSAVYSGFHVVFILREQDLSMHSHLGAKDAKDVSGGEMAPDNDNNRRFVRDYVEYASSRDVEFDKDLTPLVKGFIDDVRDDAKRFVFSLGHSSVNAIVEFSKASARMQLKDKVDRNDVIFALKIFNSALYMKNDFV